MVATECHCNLALVSCRDFFFWKCDLQSNCKMFRCSLWEDTIMNRKQEEVFKNVSVAVCKHLPALSSQQQIVLCQNMLRGKLFFCWSEQQNRSQSIYVTNVSLLATVYVSQWNFNTFVLPFAKQGWHLGKAQTRWVDWSIINVVKEGFWRNTHCQSHSSFL